jgi:hypothetical protein
MLSRNNGVLIQALFLRTHFLINAFKSHRFMKPYSLFFTAFLCLITHSIHAQKEKNETPQYKYAFKGYLNFLADSKTTTLTDDTTRTQINSSKKRTIFPAIGWPRFRENGRFFEMGITRLGFDYQELSTENKVFQRDSLGNIVPGGDIPIRGVKVWMDNIGLQFEWNFPFYFKENRDFNTYLGFSMDPSVYFQKNESLNAAAPSKRVFEFSNTLTLIPRITYAISNRCFLDLNVPISFTTFGINYNYSSNSVFPISVRETIDFRTRLPTHIWAIRLGIGYKI